MRKHTLSNLRSSGPLRVELFEERCLLSGGINLQPPALLASPLLSSLTTPTAQLMPVALPSTNGTDAAAQTATSLLSAIAAVPVLSPNPAPSLQIGSAGTDAVSSLQTVVVNPVVEVGLGSIPASSAPFLLSQTGGLASGLAGSLSEPVSATTIALTGLLSGSPSVNPVGFVSSLTADILPSGAVVDLKVNDSSIRIDLGQTTSPPVSVKLDSQATAVNTITAVVQGQEGQKVGANAIIYFDGERLPADLVVSPGQSESILQVSAAETVGGAHHAIVGVSTGGDEGHEFGPSRSEVNVSTAFEDDTESQQGVIPTLVHSAATGAAMLERSQIIAFLPSSTSPFDTILKDLAGGAESVEPVNRDEPWAAPQINMYGSAGNTEDASPPPAPHSESLLADLLPLNLASLEADIQTFLEQVEQLGAELSSMLGRMSLSPLLMATAIAAVAAEVARRRLHPSQPGSLLASCAGAAVEWLPGLTDPWSVENS